LARAIALVDGEREERERLHPIEKFGVAVAVEPARLVGEVRGWRPLAPLRPVDEETARACELGDAPAAYGCLELARWAADRVGIESQSHIARLGRSQR